MGGLSSRTCISPRIWVEVAMGRTMREGGPSRDGRSIQCLGLIGGSPNPDLESWQTSERSDS